MKGDDVKTLQNRLRLAGFLNVTFQDGVFDAATEAALIAYQKGTPYLKKMYSYNGVVGSPKPYADTALCRQLLRVPARDMTLVLYAVKRHDTLWSIASRFGLGPETVALLNNIKNPRNLHVGRELFIVCPQSRVKP